MFETVIPDLAGHEKFVTHGVSLPVFCRSGRLGRRKTIEMWRFPLCCIVASVLVLIVGCLSVRHWREHAPAYSRP